MKNLVIKTLSLLFLFPVFFSFTLKAEEVKKTDVKKVAFNAFSYYSGKKASEIKIIQEIPVMHQDTALFYVYNFEKGFIMIAADNVAEPILAFGLDAPFDFENMPPALHYLLECYQQEILYAKRQNVRSSQEINAKWEEHLNPNPSKAIYTPATWLLETTWGQYGGYANGSSITYNYYFPKTPDGTKPAAVGCGPVALAQILNFWKCSVHPQGSATRIQSGYPNVTINFSTQTYNLGNMLLNHASTNNALFLYHCAIALNAQFTDTAGTSSSPTSVAPALINNFGFTGTYLSKYSNQQSWIDLLKANIDNRRPVFYSGYKTNPPSGHGWVVDGYNSSNHFHCNWGWFGDHNDWYSLSNLTPNGEYYNDEQSAVVNIYPTYYPYPSILLQNTTIASGTRTGHTIIVDNSTIQNNANVILKANCATEIYGPFTVPVGATLEVK